MPKVSVIVPVYGVEKYIERCAHSLFEQTLDDMEFIFVDDCTTDNSIYILENIIPATSPAVSV
jgi:glycosyltransferase involved in cell wall biosynthesis